MKSCIRFAENISFSASTHKIYKPEDAKNLMFSAKRVQRFIQVCKKSDVQKYILYVFLPAAGGNFLAICSPEMQFLKGFEGYLTSKSQKFSPAAQGFGPN